VTDHHVARSTHTPELTQLAELNDALAAAGHPQISAQELDVAGPELPGHAVLMHLSADGPPEYPYIHGVFRTGPGDHQVRAALLHTAALQELSHRFGLRHRWGA
jgi:hypothetical protein